jgi:hypothetical protein
MRRTLFVLALALAVALPVQAQDPRFAFTYQGELRVAGMPADGPYDFEFALYMQPSGGVPLATFVVDDSDVLVGLFAAELNFGMTPFAADDEYWLEPRVREGDTSGGYTPLLPRQRLAPAPRALSSYTVQPAGVDSNAVQALAITTGKLADGSVTAAKLASPSVQSEHIAGNTIVADDIADGAVGPAELQMHAVETDNLGLGAVTNDRIAAGTIQADRLAFAAGDVTGIAAGAGLTGGGTAGDVVLSIADDGISGSMLPSGVIRTDEIATNAVTTDKIQSAAVTAEKVDVSQVQLRSVALSTGCAGTNQSIKTIDDAGGVTCESDDSASLVAGSGLALAGATLSIDESIVPRKDGVANQVFDAGTLVVDYGSDRIGVGVPAPQVKLEVAGTVAGDALAYRSAQSGFVFIGAPAFTANAQDDDSTGFLSEYLLPICGGSGGCDLTLHATLDLPAGVTIDDFRCWFSDTSVSQNITGNAFLGKRPYASTSAASIAAISGFTTASTNGMSEFAAVFASEIATPSTHAYAVTVFPTFGLGAALDSHRFYGCRVRYAYTQVSH